MVLLGGGGGGSEDEDKDEPHLCFAVSFVPFAALFAACFRSTSILFCEVLLACSGAIAILVVGV